MHGREQIELWSYKSKVETSTLSACLHLHFNFMRRLLHPTVIDSKRSKASMIIRCFASLNIGVSFARESLLHGRAPNEVSNQNKRKAKRRRRKMTQTIGEKQFKFARDLKYTAIAPSAFKVYSALLWIFNTRSTFLCSAKLTSFLSIKINKNSFFAFALQFRNKLSQVLVNNIVIFINLSSKHFKSFKKLP